MRTLRKQGFVAALGVIITTFLAGSAGSMSSHLSTAYLIHRISVLAASTLVDYAVTGRFCIPTLTFIHHNLLRNVSSFYGATHPFYHLMQSLPILLFPIWWWWAQGFISCLLPSSIIPQRMTTLDRPEGLRSLARAITFAIASLSLSPHSEWRFLQPFLPPLLLFALPPLFRDYFPSFHGLHHFTQSLRQYIRIPVFPFRLCLFAPVLPYLYLNAFHGRAQVMVMDVLRRGDVGNVTHLVALMPCHSTPWMSAFHRDIDAWFLTCEPPLA